MSWVEKIDNRIEIFTGDGKFYNPLYVIKSKDIEYNVSIFDFPNIAGSYVDKREPKGAVHDIDFIFQGEDHLDIALEFEKSNKDRRPWKVNHPLHGRLIWQPTRLRFDPSGINTTRITGTVIETITDEYPRVVKDDLDTVLFMFDDCIDKISRVLPNKVIVDSSDIQVMNANTNAIYENGSKAIKSGEESNAYFQAYTTAIGAINNAINDVSTASNLMTNFIVAPILFSSQVITRISLLTSQYYVLSETVPELVEPDDKNIFEVTASAIIAAIMKSAVIYGDGDYGTSNEVTDVIGQVISIFTDFENDIDQIQTNTGDTTSSYIPDFDSLSSLTALINETTSTLMNIALNAKQERFFKLDSDSNAIVLTNRFYGLDQEGVNIGNFIKQNNIGISELLGIKKDREVIYYV